MSVEIQIVPAAKEVVKRMKFGINRGVENFCAKVILVSDE